MGNSFAYLMLIIWPLLAVYWYQTKPVQSATLWVVVLGHMVLPVLTIINLPGVPPLGKVAVPSVAALGCLLIIKRRQIPFFKGLGIEKYLVVIFILSPMVTALQNPNAISYGPTYLPGQSLFDGLTYSVNHIFLVSTYFIGRALFKRYDDQLLMFKFIATAGLFYSLLILFELRMSPQLHAWIYGYFPHSFGQHMRSGGYRPVVFMGHALVVSFYSMVAFVSAVVLIKTRERVRFFSSSISAYFLFAVIVLSKSLAPIMYAIVAVIMIVFTKFKMQLKAAAIIGLFVMVYPTLVLIEAFPHDDIIDVANMIDPARAHSLAFRFKHDRDLIERSGEKPIFGWGGFARSRIFDREGKDITVSDGRWIIEMGKFGLVSFLAEFGLVLLAIFRARKAGRVAKTRKEKILLGGHSIVLSLLMLDQVPNDSFAPWTFLVSGILLGRSEQIIADSKRKVSE